MDQALDRVIRRANHSPGSIGAQKDSPRISSSMPLVSDPAVWAFGHGHGISVS